MARADLLINLVKAGSKGDSPSFRKTVEALISEERAKKHHVLADRLTDYLLVNGGSASKTIPLVDSKVQNLFDEISPRKSLGDLMLPKSVSDICSELVEEQHRADLLRSYNLEPRNRVLLAGPPGNGKTSLAEALASALMVPLILVRYDGVIGSYLGETAQRLKRLFDYAKTRRCVLFFDEFDAIGKERGDTHETGEIKRVVSSLLLQVDDLPSHVVIVTASNHPELLDRAVWRRFQLRLNLPSPTKTIAEEWFRQLERKFDMSFGYSPRSLAEKLYGLSFAELEDFGSDIMRRYVLTQPNSNVKKIVSEQLGHYKARFNIKN